MKQQKQYSVCVRLVNSMSTRQMNAQKKHKHSQKVIGGYVAW